DQQVAFLLQVRDKFSEVQKAIKDIRTLRAQLNDLTSRTKDKDIKQLSDSIGKQMTSIEEALYQTKAKSGQDVLNFPIRLNDKISGLYGFASSGNSAPAKQVKDAYSELSSQADIQLNKLKRIMEDDLVKFNQLIR